MIFKISIFRIDIVYSLIWLAQSAGAVKYTDCFSAEG